MRFTLLCSFSDCALCAFEACSDVLFWITYSTLPSTKGGQGWVGRGSRGKTKRGSSVFGVGSDTDTIFEISERTRLGVAFVNCLCWSRSMPQAPYDSGLYRRVGRQNEGMRLFFSFSKPVYYFCRARFLFIFSVNSKGVRGMKLESLFVLMFFLRIVSSYVFYFYPHAISFLKLSRTH